MKQYFILIVFGLFLIMACQSPRQKMENRVDDSVRDITQRDFENVLSFFTGSDAGNALSHYAMLCEKYTGERKLIPYDSVHFQQVNINKKETQGHVITRDSQAIKFIKRDKKWVIDEYPALEVKLTGVTFLYAMSMNYYDLAKQLLSEDSREIIHLIHQYEMMNREAKLRQPSPPFPEDFDVQLNGDRALFMYSIEDKRDTLIISKSQIQWEVMLET